jgi:endonuclease/exonuclease/phosphatase family metal-dependent hydrolase
MLRILTYNVNQASGGARRALASVIRAAQPDAVALIEAPSAAEVEALARDVGMQAAYIEGQRGDALAWLTRLHLLRAESHRYAESAAPLLEVAVSWNGQAARLFAAHLRSGRTEKSERQRAAEVASILNVLPRLTGDPHLLAGDFNALHPLDTTGERSIFRLVGMGSARRTTQLALPLLLEAGYTDCYRATHRGVLTPAAYTYPAPSPRLRYDYVFASAQLARRLVACDVLASDEARKISDHYPLLAEFV